MSVDEAMAAYNYPAFEPRYFEPLMRFGESPPLAEPGPDFPLFTLDGGETSLAEQWSGQRYLVVEFGSFT